MATLVLTAIGTAVGGPIGAAVGSILGQRLDSELFKPKGRQGPRLGELAVQTSSYGTAIPKIFGSMRVAGTVIWATDLREDKAASGGGKGQPKTTTYSYSASFAVALSGRAILSVGRIWADGKLLRGAAGDFKSRTIFRFYPGSEEQEIDPLIASAEGLGQAPAFRGVAYVVFEDFQLADYGNRIPSLTFEVRADDGPVTIGRIADELSAGAVRDGETPTLGGYAAGGDSVRGAVEGLTDIVALSLEEGGDWLIIEPAGGEPILLGRAETGTRTEGAGGPSEMRRRSAGTVPGEVSIAYYDPARDYQTGLQRAVRGAPGLRSDRRALAAAIEAGVAKDFAERRLAALWAGRATGTLHLPSRLIGLRPGLSAQIDGQSGLWKVERWTLDRMIVTLELVRLAGSVSEGADASPGRPIGTLDVLHGPTTLLLLDLPLGTERLLGRPQLLLAAAGEEPGWRRAVLTASYDGGISWEAAGSTAGVAIIGTALTALAAGESALFDEINQVEVELLNDAMWLEGRNDEALAGGANLAAIGDELIQFGRVQPLGDRRFRLAHLLRGRRGTEWAVTGHGADEGFAILEQATLAVIEPPLTAVGGEALLIGTGVGDGQDGATASSHVTGEAIRPPSPVHLRAERATNGDITIRWVRRSRNGWAWLDGGNTPLGEEQESYRLVLIGEGFERVVAMSQPSHIYTNAEQGADGLIGPLMIEVVQNGTFLPSRAARLTIS